MLTLKTVLNQISHKEIYDSLINIMENHFQDFPEVQQKYLNVMERLQNDLGDMPVEKEKEAIQKRIASTLFYSAVLGIQANLNYFLDPVSGNFLNTEPEIFLKEKTARILPDYASAQELQNQFYTGMTDAQKLIYEDVTEYICYLETSGPKLAHFYGFLLGNTVLHRIIPGYQPDMAFTLRYAMMLESFFGTDFDWNTLLQSSLLIA